MPALVVNSGTRAWEIVAASTARPRQTRVVVLTLGLGQRARDEGLDEGQPPDLATKNNLAAGAERYRKRVSGLLTIRIKGALGGNYSFDTLPWIDCFAFNAEIICLVLQNKRVAARG